MAKRSSNRIWWILGGVVVLLFGGLLVAKSAGWIGKEKAEEATFSVVKAADIVERVSASGKVQPEVEIKISPDVSGEIIELKVHEGDSVVKGQLLLRIRPDNYESLVARAKAALNQSKASYEQTKSALGQALYSPGGGFLVGYKAGVIVGLHRASPSRSTEEFY